MAPIQFSSAKICCRRLMCSCGSIVYGRLSNLLMLVPLRCSQELIRCSSWKSTERLCLCRSTDKKLHIPFQTVSPLRHLRFPHQNRRKMSSLAVEDVPDESCDFKCHRLCDWRGNTVASQLNLKTIFIQSCLRHVSSRPIGRD
ncbi:hypothetical protein TNCV_2443611 [Trichonephila clavipes]|nr:hypothetical protein TNCV_2443611 [Trichonephila clavipes]